tara:strand:+ start:67 stop:366 length:300 start_codon:yes stop_codon:yes gene_type:complete
MKKIFLFLLLSIFTLNSCGTITTKVDEKTQVELDKMSKYIGYSLNEVYLDYGNDGVHSVDNKGYKKVTFTTKKLGVKCKRIFFYDRSMIVSSIKFAGCW